MKLLVISAAFPPSRSGEADHALHLCERLTDRGLDVHVLTTKRDLETRNFPFQVYSIMPGWSWQDLPRFATFFRRCAPDAVLLIYSDRDYDCHPMMTLAPSIAKALRPSASFVTQFETEYVARKAPLVTRAALKTMACLLGSKNFDYVFGTLLAKSDRIIALSERHAAKLARCSAKHAEKGLVIPPPPLLRMRIKGNAGSRQLYRERVGVRADDFLLAYYGYVYAEKGIETLLQALHILTRLKDNIRLVMIGGCTPTTDGSPYVSRMNALAQELDVEKKIIWTGEYSSDSDEASGYLSAADAGVFPFKYGVTLNRSSVAAAAAHGVPIVTTRAHPLENAFRDGENVLLFSPENPNELASAVSSLIDNRALRGILSAGALALAAEYFSWDKAVNRTIEALRL